MKTKFSIMSKRPAHFCFSERIFSRTLRIAMFLAVFAAGAACASTIVWMGDSSVRFFTPSSTIGEHSVTNVKTAVSGSCIYSQPLAYAAPVAAQLDDSALNGINPDIVVLQGGLNDSWVLPKAASDSGRGLSEVIGTVQSGGTAGEDTFAGSMERLIIAAREKFPDADICFWLQYDIDDPVYDQIAAAAREITAKYSLKTIDAYSVLSQSEAPLHSPETDGREDDGIHISNAGYDVIKARVLNPALEEILTERTAAPAPEPGPDAEPESELLLYEGFENGPDGYFPDGGSVRKSLTWDAGSGGESAIGFSADSRWNSGTRSVFIFEAGKGLNFAPSYTAQTPRGSSAGYATGGSSPGQCQAQWRAIDTNRWTGVKSYFLRALLCVDQKAAGALKKNNATGFFGVGFTDKASASRTGFLDTAAKAVGFLVRPSAASSTGYSLMLCHNGIPGEEAVLVTDFIPGRTYVCLAGVETDGGTDGRGILRAAAFDAADDLLLQDWTVSKDTEIGIPELVVIDGTYYTNNGLARFDEIAAARKLSALTSVNDKTTVVLLR